MTIEQIFGVFATIAAAVIVGLLSLTGVRSRLRAQERAQAQAREEAADQIVRRYRDPLVHAAFDLQSRLYNIVTHDFLGTYYTRGTEPEKRYAIENTLYVIAEYFGWVEVMRREVQFLDLRDITRNRHLATRLDVISGTFLAFRPDTTLRVFRGEQRAIGEVMMVRSPGGSRECIGFAEFVTRRDDPTFSRWFDKLGADVELLASEPGRHLERAVAIQQVLVDLLDLLDPVNQYFPDSGRRKLPTAEAEAQPVADGSSGGR